MMNTMNLHGRVAVRRRLHSRGGGTCTVLGNVGLSKGNGTLALICPVFRTMPVELGRNLLEITRAKLRARLLSLV